MTADIPISGSNVLTSRRRRLPASTIGRGVFPWFSGHIMTNINEPKVEDQLLSC